MIAQRPISLSESDGAGCRCSVFTSTRYRIVLTAPGTTLLVCLKRYCRPGTSGSSVIQTSIASNLWSTFGALPGRTSMSPRLESISSSSVSVTDCGANASSNSPSNVTIDFTRLFLREGSETISSPLRMMPEAIVPEKPRKSRLGRRTYCTGKRKSSMLRSEPM